MNRRASRERAGKTGFTRRREGAKFFPALRPQAISPPGRARGDGGRARSRSLVIPAQAGISLFLAGGDGTQGDSSLRRNDGPEDRPLFAFFASSRLRAFA